MKNGIFVLLTFIIFLPFLFMCFFLIKICLEDIIHTKKLWNKNREEIEKIIYGKKII